MPFSDGESESPDPDYNPQEEEENEEDSTNLEHGGFSPVHSPPTAPTSISPQHPWGPSQYEMHQKPMQSSSESDEDNIMVMEGGYEYERYDPNFTARSLYKAARDSEGEQFYNFVTQVIYNAPNPEYETDLKVTDCIIGLIDDLGNVEIDTSLPLSKRPDTPLFELVDRLVHMFFHSNSSRGNEFENAHLLPLLARLFKAALNVWLQRADLRRVKGDELPPMRIWGLFTPLISFPFRMVSPENQHSSPTRNHMHYSHGMMKEFAKSSGFEILEDAFNRIITYEQALFDEEFKPITNLLNLMYLHTRIARSLIPAPLKTPDSGMTNIFCRIEKWVAFDTSDDLLKDIANEDIHTLFMHTAEGKMHLCARNSNDMEDHHFSMLEERLARERWELCFNVAKRRVTSSYLASRLNGLTAMKKMIEESSKFDQSAYPYRRLFPPKSENLAGLFKQCKIIDILFGENCHPELVSRSKEILQFLAQNDVLVKDNLRLIWETAHTQHGSVTQAIYALLPEIAPELDEEHLQFMFEEFSKTPIEEMGTNLIELIFRFTRNIFDSVYEKTRDCGWAGLECFQARFFSSKLSRQENEAAMYRLVDLLHMKYASRNPRIFQYFKRVVKAIETRTANCHICYVFLYQLISRLSRDDTEAVVTEVSKHRDEFMSVFTLDFLYMFADNLTEAEQAALTAKGCGDMKKRELARSSSVIDKEAELRSRLRLLNWLNLYVDHFGFTIPWIKRMWEILIGPGKDQELSDNFCRWVANLISEESYQKHEDQTDQATIDFIADELIPSMDVQNLSEDGFKLMFTFFKYSNLNRRVFIETKRQSQPFQVISLDIRGFENLWNVIFECRVTFVSEKAITSLKTLLISCIPSLKQTIFEKAIEIVMHKLRQPNLSQLAIKRSFSVLHMMKRDLEIKKHRNYEAIETVHFLVVDNRCARPEQEKQKFRIDNSTTVGDLKEKLSKKLDCRTEQIMFIAMGKPQNDDSVLVRPFEKNGMFRVSRPKHTDSDDEKQDGEMEEKTDDPDPSEMHEYEPPDPTEMLLEKDVFETLCQYLSCEYPDCAETCWELLSKLPKSKVFIEDFKDFEEMRWKKHLQYNETSYLALYYHLEIILHLLDSDKSSIKEENAMELDDVGGFQESWTNRFFRDEKSSGMVLLLGILKDFKYGIDQRLFHRIWCFQSMIRIVTKYLKRIPNQVVSRANICQNLTNGSLIKRLLLFLQLIADVFSKNQEKVVLRGPLLNNGPNNRMKDNKCFVLHEHTLLDQNMEQALTQAFEEIFGLLTLLYCGKHVPESSRETVRNIVEDMHEVPNIFSMLILKCPNQNIRGITGTKIRELCGQYLKPDEIRDFEEIPSMTVDVHNFWLSVCFTILKLRDPSEKDDDSGRGKRVMKCLSKMDNFIHKSDHTRCISLWQLVKTLLDELFSSDDKFEVFNKDTSTSERVKKKLGLKINDWYSFGKLRPQDVYDSAMGTLLEYPIMETTRPVKYYFPHQKESSERCVQDYALQGYMDLADRFVKRYQLEIKLEDIKHIFNKLLFDFHEAEKMEDKSPPVCKHPESRKNAFDLLKDMVSEELDIGEVKQQRDNLDCLMKLLMKHHLKKLDTEERWFYYPCKSRISESGYVGLKNLGATCYMNSLFQQLYMVPIFRCGIISRNVMDLAKAKLKRKKDKAEKDKEGKERPGLPDMDDPKQIETVIKGMQTMFAYLQESKLKYWDPQSFIRSYSKAATKVNVGQQQDVDEFCAQLFDKLEEELGDDGMKTLLQYVFGGLCAHQLIGQNECTHYKERVERFFNLQLDIKNKRHIHDSLKAYVNGDLLAGDNKYFCNQCSTRVDTLKRACIRTLPRNLILHLKRFEFDLDTFRRVKLNGFLEFPEYLDLEPYTKAGLEKREGRKYVAQELEEDEKKDRENWDEIYDTTTKTSIFRLSGVIAHTGTCDSGHYYSFIRERNPEDNLKSNWFNFNDAEVVATDVNSLKDQCFGGSSSKDGCPWDSNVPSSQCKPYNAYMLFYERMSDEDAAKFQKENLDSVVDLTALGNYHPSDPKELKKNEVQIGDSEFEKGKKRRKIDHHKEIHGSNFRKELQSSKPHEIPTQLSKEDRRHIVSQELNQEIMARNRRVARDVYMFDPSYFQFIVDVTKIRGRRREFESRTFPISSPVQLRLAFFFNTVCRLRSHMRKSHWTSEVHRKLRESLYNDNNASAWFLCQLMKRPDWCEVLVRCSDSKARKQALELIVRAVACVMNTEKMQEDSDVPDVDVYEFIDKFLRLMPKCFERYATNECEEYFDLLRVFCQFSPSALAHLIKRGCIQKFLAAFQGEFHKCQPSDDEESYDFTMVEDIYGSKKETHAFMKPVLRVLSVILTSSEDKVKMGASAKRISSETQLAAAGNGSDDTIDAPFLGILDSNWELGDDLLELFKNEKLIEFLVLNSNVHEEQAAYHILSHLVHHENEQIFDIVLDVVLPRALRHMKQHHEELFSVLLAVDPSSISIHGNPGRAKRARLFQQMIRSIDKHPNMHTSGRRAEKFGDWMCELVAKDTCFQDVLLQELFHKRNWLLTWIGSYSYTQDESCLSETAVKLFNSLLSQEDAHEEFWVGSDGFYYRLRDHILDSFEGNFLNNEFPSSNLFNALSSLVERAKNITPMLEKWGEYEIVVQQIVEKFSDGMLASSYLVDVLGNVVKIIKQFQESETSLELRKTSVGRDLMRGVDFRRMAEILCETKWGSTSKDELWPTVVDVLFTTWTTIVKTMKPVDVDRAGFSKPNFVTLMKSILAGDFLTNVVLSESGPSPQMVKTGGHIYQFILMLFSKSPTGAIGIRRAFIQMILAHPKPGSYAFFVLRQCLSDREAFIEFEDNQGLRYLLSNPLLNHRSKDTEFCAPILFEIVADYCNWVVMNRRRKHAFQNTRNLDLFTSFYTAQVLPYRRIFDQYKGRQDKRSRSQLMIHKATCHILEFLEKSSLDALQDSLRRQMSHHTANNDEDVDMDLERAGMDMSDQNQDKYLSFDSSMYERFHSFENLDVKDSLTLIFEALEKKMITSPIWNPECERKIIKSLESDIGFCEWLLTALSTKWLVLVFTCDIPRLREFLVDCIETSMVHLKQRTGQKYIATEPNPDLTNPERPDPPSKRRKIDSQEDSPVLNQFADKLLTCLKGIFTLKNSHPYDLLQLIQHFAFLGQETMKYVATHGFKTMYEIFTTDFNNADRNKSELQRLVYQRLERDPQRQNHMQNLLSVISSVVVSITFGDEWKENNEAPPNMINSGRFMRRYRGFEQIIPFGLDSKIEETSLSEIFDLIQSDTFRRAATSHQKWGGGMMQIYSYLYQNSKKATVERLGAWVRLFASPSRPARPYKNFLNVILGCEKVYSKTYGTPALDKVKIMWETILEEVANFDEIMDKCGFRPWLEERVTAVKELRLAIMKKFENPKSGWVLKMFLHKFRTCRELITFFIINLLKENSACVQETWTNLLSFLLDFINSSKDANIPVQIFTSINEIADHFEMRNPIIRILPKLLEIFCTALERRPASGFEEPEIMAIAKLLTTILEEQKEKILETVDIERIMRAIIQYRPMLEYSMKDCLKHFFKLLKPLCKLLPLDRFQHLQLERSAFFQLIYSKGSLVDKQLDNETQNIVRIILAIIFKRWDMSVQGASEFRLDLLKLIDDIHLRSDDLLAPTFWPYFLLLECCSDEKVMQQMTRTDMVVRIMTKVWPKIAPGQGLSYLLKIFTRYFEWILSSNLGSTFFMRCGQALEKIADPEQGKCAVLSKTCTMFNKHSKMIGWRQFLQTQDRHWGLEEFFPLFDVMQRMGLNVFGEFLTRWSKVFQPAKDEEMDEEDFFFNKPYQFRAFLNLAEAGFVQLKSRDSVYLCMLWAQTFLDNNLVNRRISESEWDTYETLCRWFEKPSDMLTTSHSEIHTLWNFRFLGYNQSSFECMHLKDIPNSILKVFDRGMAGMIVDHPDYFGNVIDWILQSAKDSGGKIMDLFISLSTICAGNERKFVSYLQEEQRTWKPLIELMEQVDRLLDHEGVRETIRERHEVILQMMARVEGLAALLKSHKE